MAFCLLTRLAIKLASTSALLIASNLIKTLQPGGLREALSASCSKTQVINYTEEVAKAKRTPAELRKRVEALRKRLTKQAKPKLQA